MQNSTTDNTNSAATLGRASDAVAANHLTKDSSPMTVTSQVEVGGILEIDSRVLEGSHGTGDHRQQAASVSPLKGNDTAQRSPVDDSEGVGA